MSPVTRAKSVLVACASANLGSLAGAAARLQVENAATILVRVPLALRDMTAVDPSACLEMQSAAPAIPRVIALQSYQNAVILGVANPDIAVGMSLPVCLDAACMVRPKMDIVALAHKSKKAIWL